MIANRIYLVLRWLLQADRPVAARADGEIEAEASRNYRWNFTVNLLDGATFWFGASFISSATIVPLFISKLTPSPLVIGLVAVIAQGGWFLPQVFTSNLVERLPRKKPVVVNLGFFLERLPVWVLAISALLAEEVPALALALFLLAFAWFGLGAGLVATAWQDLIARCFPVDRRGRFFGLTTFIGNATGTLGAALSAWLLAALAFPTNFVAIFGLAALSILASWAFLALTRESVWPVTGPRQSNRQFWHSLPEILRQDHNYRRFLVARLLLAMGGMGVGFVTVSAVARWQVSDGTVGLYTTALLLGQAAGTLAAGLLADRRGHKLSLELGALIACLAFLVCWLAPSPNWFFLVFALLGASGGTIIVSGILVVLEFCRPQRRPTYTGLTNTVVGVVAVAAPLVGAWLATIDYGWLFAATALFNLLAVVALHWWVQEPRWANARLTL